MHNKKLDQYFTPAWAAAMLYNRHFGYLGNGDTILDPASGDGRLLMAVPENVGAYGVEIDPVQAAAARSNSGREVITGDFLDVDLPRLPTAIIGNPPFKLKLIESFLGRAYECLEYGGKVGFILPVYIFQTANTVMRLGSDWSISQELLPRNLFQGLEKPILFASFVKDKKTSLTGFFLYSEVAAMDQLRKEYRALCLGNGSRANCWREVAYAALSMLGGEASLKELYAHIEKFRPTANPFWREQIRKVLAKSFTRVDKGVYAL